MDNLAQTIAEVNAVLQKVNAGEGTAARLMNDGEAVPLPCGEFGKSCRASGRPQKLIRRAT
ncbi:MAG: hypothetical protein L6V35_05045 [Alistipes putredinis]|nr:MAG: hypothetical protein L6V35_05045 [Alistipes putredinis]